MKKSIMNILPILLTLLLFFSCEKDSLPDPDDCPNPPCNDEPASSKLGVLDTLWSVQISDNYLGTEHIKVLNGILYFSAGSYLIAYETTTGNKLWEWYDPAFGRRALSFEKCKDGHSAILQNFSRIMKVDLSNGQTITSYHQDIPNFGSNARGILLGDYAYYTQLKNDRSHANLVRSHKNDLQNWEVVYDLVQGEDTRGSWANMESYNLWVNPNNGDSVLVFQHRMAVPDRVDVVAFSLNTREILWRHNDINTSGNSNHQQMLVMNDKAYIMAAEVVIAYDMFTGEVVWEHFAHDLAIRFMFHKFGFAESINAILVKGNSHRLYGLDPETGEKNLFVEDATFDSVGSGSPTYHNGIIYYTTYGQLHAIRAATGEILWKEDSSMRHNTGFNGDIAIDKENGVLFAADGYYLYAIRAYGN